MLQKVVPGRNETAALVICDIDGNAKAMSDWVSPLRAEEIARELESRGVSRFSGDVKLPF
jgi:hypothetical protein